MVGAATPRESARTSVNGCVKSHHRFSLYEWDRPTNPA